MQDGYSTRMETEDLGGQLLGAPAAVRSHASDIPATSRSDISVTVLPAKNLGSRENGAHWFTDETALAFMLRALAHRDSLDVERHPGNITRVKLWPPGRWAELGMPGKGYVEHSMAIDLLLPYTLQQLEKVGPIVHLRPGPLLPEDDPANTVSLGMDLAGQFPPGCDLTSVQIHTVEVTDLSQGWAVPLVLTVKTGEEENAKWEESMMQLGSPGATEVFDAVAAQARIYQEVHHIWLDPMCSYITLNPGVVIGAGDTVGVSKADLTMEMRRPYGPWAPDRLVGRTGNLTASDIGNGLMLVSDLFVNAPGYAEYMSGGGGGGGSQRRWATELSEWVLVPPEHFVCPDLMFAIRRKEDVSTLLLVSRDGEAVNLLAYVIRKSHVEEAIRCWTDTMSGRRVLTDLSRIRITVSSANGPTWLPKVMSTTQKKATGSDSLEETLARKHGPLAIRIRFGMKLFPTDRSHLMPVNGETVRPTVFSSKHLLARVMKRVVQRRLQQDGDVKETKRKTTEADDGTVGTLGTDMQVVEPEDLAAEVGDVEDEEYDDMSTTREERDRTSAAMEVGLFYEGRTKKRRGD